VADARQQGGPGQLSDADEPANVTVLDAVLRSDAVRLRAEQEAAGERFTMASPCHCLTSLQALSRVMDTGDGTALREAVSAIRLRRAHDDLEEARRVAIKRSGARGADARKALIAAERHIEEVQARCVRT
jgi:hypothetical protein